MRSVRKLVVNKCTHKRARGGARTHLESCKHTFYGDGVRWVCVCLRGDGRFCKLIFIDRVPCCCCSMTCSHRSRTLRPCSICRARSANFLKLERYLSLPNDLRKWQVKWLRWRQLMTAGSYDENRIWREFAWNLLQIVFSIILFNYLMEQYIKNIVFYI